MTSRSLHYCSEILVTKEMQIRATKNTISLLYNVVKIKDEDNKGRKENICIRLQHANYNHYVNKYGNSL